MSHLHRPGGGLPSKLIVRHIPASGKIPHSVSKIPLRCALGMPWSTHNAFPLHGGTELKNHFSCICKESCFQLILILIFLHFKKKSINLSLLDSFRCSFMVYIRTCWRPFESFFHENLFLIQPLFFLDEAKILDIPPVLNVSCKC